MESDFLAVCGVLAMTLLSSRKNHFAQSAAQGGRGEPQYFAIEEQKSFPVGPAMKTNRDFLGARGFIRRRRKDCFNSRRRTRIEGKGINPGTREACRSAYYFLQSINSLPPPRSPYHCP